MTLTMQAAVYHRYGAPEVLQVQSVQKPVPQANEVLIKVAATAVNSGDCRLRRADPFAVRFFFGLFKPKQPILGNVLSGEVVAVGKNVHNFKVGDLIFGSTQVRMGAYAEYLCLPADGALALKPTSLSHEEAAALPFGGTTAWHFLQQCNIQPGQKVLVYGASGAVGATAVQIAKYLGAEVTAVCSGANASLVKMLGADRVIDYTQAEWVGQLEQYDVFYEAVNKIPVSLCLSAVKPEGVLILGAAMMPEMLQGLWAKLFGAKKVLFGMAAETAESMAFLRKLAEAGQLKAVIDRSFSLLQIAEAHAYVDGGHKRGNVVVRVA